MMDQRSQEYGVGAIIILFHETVSEQTAREYIKSLGLQPAGWAELFHSLVVYVPAGEEKEWIDRLSGRKNQFIRTVFLNLLTEKRIF